MPWKALYMDEREGQLNALPCCANWINMKFGNLQEMTSVGGLWNGPGAQAIRRLIIEGRQDEVCKPDCPWLVSRRFDEKALTVIPGPSKFEDNQRLNNEEIRQRKTVLQSFPMAIRIIPTLYCNLRCRMCHQDHRADLLIPEDFIDEVRHMGPYIYDYQLHGGEVLISRHLGQWVDPGWFAANPQMLLSLVTNGTYLPRRSWKILKQVRVNYITVSINAATREIYRYMTDADLFDNVIRNTIALRELGLNHPVRNFQVFLSYVISRGNYRELPAFVHMANELRLPFRLLLVVGNRFGESIYTDPPILKEVLALVNEVELLSPEESRLEVTRIQQSIKASLAEQAGRVIS
jgi:pyruvate-formate lyase-activating enzyme